MICMSETELMMATQQVSLLRMQMLKQQQVVWKARLEAGAAYDAALADLEALRSELEAAEKALRKLAANA